MKKLGTTLLVLAGALVLGLGSTAIVYATNKDFKSKIDGIITKTATDLTIDNVDLSKKPVSANLEIYCTDAGGVNTATVMGLGKEYDSDYINIPEAVTAVGQTYTVTGIAENAYLGGGHVVGIYVPASVTTVGRNSFQDDNYIYFNDGYVEGQTLKKVQFSADSKISALSGTASDGTTKYGYFEHLSELRSVILPTGVTSIGDMAFYRCAKLQSVTIGSKVTAIGTSAFAGCASLKSVAIPSGVASLGDNAFAGCTSLSAVAIPDSVTSVGSNCFGADVSIKTATVGTGLTSLSYNMFGGCSSLASFNVGKQVTSIGRLAFNDCTSLSSVTFEAGAAVTMLDNQSFFGCKALREIELPDSLTNIMEGAFQKSGLKKVVGGTGTILIQKDAFADCHDLAEVILRGSGVTTIGDNAFNNCWNAKIYTNNANASLFTDAANPEKCPVYVFGSWTYAGGKVTLGDGAKPANATTSAGTSSAAA